MKFKKEKLVQVFLLLGLVIPAFAFALPEGEDVVAGSATFDLSQANTLNINTSSDKLIVNYNSFNIAQPEAVRFQQPSDNSIVLNRVVGVDPSSIMGTLSANGRVFIVNPNGILFGPNSHVDVAGLVASSLNIANDDFLNGNYVFSKSGKNGYVINQGIINVKSSGYVCLLGGAVDNRLAIQADLGTVILASGEKITLALEDQNEISVVVDEAVQSEVFGPDGNKITSAIKNNGLILAEGGKVILTVKVLNKVFDQAINNTGLVKVTSLVKHDGIIELMAEGAPIVNSGTLEAQNLYIAVSNAGITNAPEGKIIAEVSTTALIGGNIFLEAASILQQGFISANVEQGTAGEISMVSENNTILDENSSTEARVTGIAGNGGRITVDSKKGSVFVNRNAKIDFSAGTVSGNGGILRVDAFQQLGFYGILNGRAPPGFQPGKAILDPLLSEISGVFSANTVIYSPNNITITGDISFSSSLTILADHNSATPGDWNDGIGAIINTGDYTISALGSETDLLLMASSGIGSADYRILTSVNNLVVVNRSTNGIYISNNKSLVLLAAVNTGTNAPIDIVASGDISVRYGIIGNGGINLTAQGGSIFLSTIANISAPGATVSLSAAVGISRTNMEVEETNGLLAYWNFDDNYGSYAYDVSGEYQYAYINGNPVWQAEQGKFGAGYSFDGIDDYMSVSGDFNLGGGPFTLIVYYQGTQSTNNLGIVGASPGSSGYALESQYGLLQSWVNEDMDKGTHLINDGFWHQLVMVRNGGQGSLYIDGVPELLNFDTSSGTVDTTANFWIGGWGHPKRLTQGKLDDVRVYNQALSGLEIYAQTLINPGAGEIRAGNVVLSAANGIDLAMNGVQSLTATNNGTGNINITNKGDFQVADSGINNYGGDIDLRVMSTLTVNGLITASGSVYLSASDDIILNGYPSLGSISASGNIYLDAGGDITLTNAIVYSFAVNYAGPAASGAVRLTAGGSINISGNSGIYSEAVVYSADPAVSGAVSFIAGGDILIVLDNREGPAIGSYAYSAYGTSITGDVIFTASGYYVPDSDYANININSRVDANNFVVTAYNGSISIDDYIYATGDITLAANNDIELYGDLSANNKISVLSTVGSFITGEVVDLRANYFNISAANDFQLYEGEVYFALSSETPYSLAQMRSPDWQLPLGVEISSTQGHSLTVTDYFNTEEYIILSALGGGVLQVDAYGSLSSGFIQLFSEGNIQIYGSLSSDNYTNITSSNGNIIFDVSEGYIFASGDIRFEAAGNIEVFGGMEGDNIYLLADCHRDEDGYRYSDGIGYLTIDAGYASLTASGDMDLEAVQDIMIKSSLGTQDLTIISNNGAVTINAVYGYINPSGDLMIDAVYQYINITADGDVTIEASGNIALNNSLNGGIINVTSSNGNIIFDVSEGNITASGDIKLQAAGDIYLNTSLISGNNIEMIADSDASGDGSLTVSANDMIIYLIGYRHSLQGANAFDLLESSLSEGQYSLSLSSGMEVTLASPDDSALLGLSVTSTGEYSVAVSSESHTLVRQEYIILNSAGPLVLDAGLDAGYIELFSGQDMAVNADLTADVYILMNSSGAISITAESIFAGTDQDIEIVGAFSSGSLFVNSDIFGGSFILLYSDGNMFVDVESISAGTFLGMYSNDGIDVNAELDAQNIYLLSEGDMFVRGYAMAETIDMISSGGIMEISGMSSGSYLYADAGDDLRINGIIEAESDISLYTGNNLHVYADMYAPAIDLQAAGNIISGEGNVTFYGQNHSFRSADDFIINKDGNTVSSGNFNAILNGADYPLGSLTVYSTAGSVTVGGPLERGDYGLVQLYGMSGVILDAQIVMGRYSSLYVVSYNGSIIAGSEVVKGQHIISAGQVYLRSGMVDYYEPEVIPQVMIGSEEFPLDVLITGEGSLNLACYGAIEGVSGWLSGTIREMTTPDAVILSSPAPGIVYFNKLLLNPEPEPELLPELETVFLAPVGNIIANQPNVINAANLAMFRFSSLIGPVFFYHPLTETDMAAFDQLSFGADDYQFQNGELQLIGHDSLLQFFQEFDQKKKKKVTY